MIDLFALLESVVTFFSSMIETVVWFVKTAPFYVEAIASTFAFLPLFVVPFIVMSLTVTVVLGIIKLL